MWKITWNLICYFCLLSSVMLQSFILIHVTLLHLPGKCSVSVGLELGKDLHWLFEFSRLQLCLSPSLWVIIHLCMREAWRWGVHLIELRGTKGQLWYHGFWQGEELKTITVTWSCHIVCFNSDFVWQAARGKKKSIFYSRWQILNDFVLSVVLKAWSQSLIMQPLSWNQTFWRKVPLLWRKREKCNFSSSFLLLLSSPFPSRM